MKQELVTLHGHMGSLPGFLVGSVLIIFLVFVVLCLVSNVGCLFPFSLNFIVIVTQRLESHII